MQPWCLNIPKQTKTISKPLSKIRKTIPNLGGRDVPFGFAAFMRLS